MRIVIDLGCKSYGGPDDSIDVLIDRYRPAFLFGFDPQAEEATYRRDLPGSSTTVVISTSVAWTHSGTVQFGGEGQRASVRGENCTHAHAHRCFDIAGLLRAVPRVAELIVKMDIEGGEYPLLQHLAREYLIDRVETFLVEWHTDEYTNGHFNGLARETFENAYPGRFDVWHDPLHARCCNGESPELRRARELVIPF